MKPEFFKFMDFLDETAQIFGLYAFLRGLRAEPYKAGISDRKEKHHGGASNPKGKSFAQSKKWRRQVPKCLRSKCPKYHFVKDCERSVDEEKKPFAYFYWKQKADEKAKTENTLLRTRLVYFSSLIFRPNSTLK